MKLIFIALTKECDLSEYLSDRIKNIKRIINDYTEQLSELENIEKTLKRVKTMKKFMFII